MGKIQTTIKNAKRTLSIGDKLNINCIFICVHFTQKENWQLVKAAIITHISFFSSQQEHKGMISLNKKMTVTSLLHQLNIKNLTGGIIKKKRLN